MKLSYCTTCYNRLWQLAKTLPHNTQYLKSGEVELVIVAYNDDSVLPFLQANYADYLNDGRIRVIEHTEDKIFSDGSRWSCGYVKDIAHRAGLGDVLFNLDADNFIDDELHQTLLTLPANTLLITKQSEWQPDGRSGRIGCHKSDYGKIYYRDKGRNDDGDFMLQAHLARIKKIQIPCLIKPIPNKQEPK